MEHFSWWQSVVFPYINFFIFLVVLLYFIRGPLRKIARQRRDDYEALLEKSLQAQRRAAEELAALNQRVAGIDAEIQRIQQRIREEAHVETQKIEQKSQELTRYLDAEAERVSQAEVARAKEQLREEILALVKDNLSQQIRENWHEPEQTAYVARSLQGFKEALS